MKQELKTKQLKLKIKNLKKDKKKIEDRITSLSIKNEKELIESLEYKLIYLNNRIKKLKTKIKNTKYIINQGGPNHERNKLKNKTRT